MWMMMVLIPSIDRQGKFSSFIWELFSEVDYIDKRGRKYEMKVQ